VKSSRVKLGNFILGTILTPILCSFLYLISAAVNISFCMNLINTRNYADTGSDLFDFVTVPIISVFQFTVKHDLSFLFEWDMFVDCRHSHLSLTIIVPYLALHQAKNYHL